MSVSLALLIGLVLVAVVVAYVRDPALPGRGVLSAFRMVRGVGLELVLGFLLAGMLNVLIPQTLVARWLSDQLLWRGLFIGWAAGIILPGGPHLLFPIAASLVAHGAGAGPLIALLSAKLLVNVVRTLTYEAPLLGWPLTLARLAPAVIVPPVLGLAGHWIFRYLRPP